MPNDHLLAEAEALSTPAAGGQMPVQGGAAGALAMRGDLNAGAVAIESERAIAEARGQMQLAKMFPRDENKAYAELMKACKMPAFAGVAFYSVPRAGGAVTGPSIRLAEELARVYCNFEYGHRELSRSAGKSEVEVYAWDKENNNRSIRQITVPHVRDTKGGQVPLRDQKDIDDKIANVASKQVRGRILALVPKWMLEAAIEECRKTLSGNNEEPIEVRVRRMIDAFAKFGVKPSHLEGYLEHPLDQVTRDELVDLTGIYNAIKDGAPVADFFGAKEAAEPTPAGAAIGNVVAQGGQLAAAAGQGQEAAPARTRRTTRAATVPAPSSQPPADDAVDHGGTAAPQAGTETANAQAGQQAAPAQQQAPVQEPAPAATQQAAPAAGGRPALF